MVPYGFLGFGHMAQMLIGALIRYAGVAPDQILVARRDKSRLEEIGALYPGVGVCASNEEVARQSQCLFLCMKPREVLGVLEGIRPILPPEVHLVSLAVLLDAEEIQAHGGRPATKLIPSMTSQIGEGVSLVCHGSRVSPDRARALESCLGAFSQVKQLPEQALDGATDITSCAPGFIAEICREFALSAVRHIQQLDPSTIVEMMGTTLYATAKLMKETGIPFESLVEQVATKGGITEVGVAALQEGLPPVFDRVFEDTLEKMDSARKGMTSIPANKP